MTDCDRIRGDLKSYADAELPLLRRAAVRRHVAQCAACREELKQMTQISESLRAEEARQDEIDIDPALRERLVSIPTYAPNGQGSPRRKPRLIQAIGLVGVLCVVIVGGLTFSHSMLLEYTPNASLAPNPPPPAMEKAQVYSNVPADAQKSLPSMPYGSQTDDEAGSAQSSPPATARTAAPVEGAPDLDRRVHKEASITVSVDDPETKSDDITAMARAAGGYIASNDLETGDDGLKTATMTVKIPVADFETILGQIAHLGNVMAKSITGQDITQQVSDANQEEQVLSDEASRAQARLALLGRKAKWEDDEAASDLRVQLAEARARLVLLKKMGEISTISVTLTQTPKKPTPAPPTAGFMGNMTDTGRTALGSLIGAVETLLTGVIWMVIFAPLWLPALLCGRWAYRRWTARASTP